MAARERAQLAREAPQRIGPIDLAPLALDLAGEQVGEAVEQLGAVGDVAVDRHRLDAELGSEPAHRQRLRALAVDERERGREDRRTRELGRAAAAAAAAGAGFAHLAGLAVTVGANYDRAR